MEEAVNVPLPSNEVIAAAQEPSKPQYSTSLHSFVSDNQSVNPTDWHRNVVPRHPLGYRSYNEPYDRSNAPSRNFNNDVALQDFPLPTSHSVNGHEGRHTPRPANRTEPDHIFNHNSTRLETQEPIEELRRKLAEYELPLLQLVNENNNDPSFDPIKEEEEHGEQQLSYDLVAPYQNGEAPLHSWRSRQN